MKYKLLILTLFIAFLPNLLRADEPIQFTATAPRAVTLDKPFQLVYTVNTHDAKDMRLPEISDFDILAGPFQERGSSYEFSNGKQTSRTYISYTYTLRAKNEGTFTIPSASVMVKSEKYSSNGLSINVLPADAPVQQQNRQSSGNDGASEISQETLFIRTIVSKTNVYEQEALLLTYKLYTVLDVTHCSMKKNPEFNDFIRNDIELTNREFVPEHYNGRNYKAVTLYEILLFPQRSGNLKLDKVDFEAVVMQRRPIRSIFDDPYTNVSYNLSAPSVTINVKDLPENKPASFTGAVGKFTMNSSISANEIKAHEAVTLKININGSGNLRMIKQPEVKFPESFETYDPKVTNDFKMSAAGVSGTKAGEYLVIPRQSGNFDIPSVEFSYFDIQEKQYKTLRTPAYAIAVEKGEQSDVVAVVGGSSVSKENLRQLGSDIRYIYTDNVVLKTPEKPLFGTLNAWLMYLVPLFLALVGFIFFRKQAKDNANIDLMRNRKANKQAQKRLKAAQKLLNEGKKDLFYDEVLKSVWTYLSDKLSISAAGLTKERVGEELTQKGVEATLTQEFMQILNTCEFARYAPNTGQEEMGNLYDDAITAITKLEQAIKKTLPASPKGRS